MDRIDKSVEMKWNQRTNLHREREKKNAHKRKCILVPLYLWYVWYSHYYRHNDHRIRLKRTHETTTTAKLLIESELKLKVIAIAIPSHLLIYDTVQVIRAFRRMECHPKYLNLGITLVWNMNLWVAIRYESGNCMRARAHFVTMINEESHLQL